MTQPLNTMSIMDMQRELSANFRVLEKLYPQGRFMTSKPYRPDQFSKSRTKEDKLSDVLQWISLYFMTGKGRKNVSAAFTPSDTVSVTFHLSSYPNPDQTDEDRAVISGFKAATIKALQAMRRDKDKYDVKSDLDHFRDLAVKHTWPEIRKKIYKIRNADKYTNIKVHNLLETFQKHVEAWSDLQKSRFEKARSQQTSQPQAHTATIAKPKAQSPTIDPVINSYRQLLTSEPDEHQAKDLVHNRSTFMAKMLEYCELIDTSAFMKHSLLDYREGGDREWQQQLGRESSLFLKDVSKHIRRLRMYSAGMTTYLKDGLARILPVFKAYQDPDSFLLQHIQFNWIKYPELTSTSKVAPLMFPGKPAPWVTAQLSSYDPVKVQAAPRDKVATLGAKAESLWKDGEPITGTIHCEIALISYLVKNKVKIQHNMIGTARAVCLACQHYINHCRYGCTRVFYYHSIAKKITYDWIIPSVAGAPEEHWEKSCLADVCQRARELAQTTLLSHLKG